MIDLGWTWLWLAVQVAVAMVPALGLYALATRRGPDAAAWVASLSLGLVVVLSGLAFLPGPAREAEVSRVTRLLPSNGRSLEPSTFAPSGESAKDVTPRPTLRPGLPLMSFRLAWDRWTRSTAAPVARLRPWGRAVAVVALAGSGVGLIRLVVGLWAVGLCRWRGRLVEDPGMIGLVEELREAMGCGPRIELREVVDLTTPATAGWPRPMLLLPDDWRGWDEAERRAVVAHELAHVVRGDYAAGLLARVAVVLNFHHPMVRWMAGRLHLEQELAADAMGARFAGGRSSYLMALSRLALKQDGRSPSWPARAFLPARGTLIRRIQMLRDENLSKQRPGMTWSTSRRLSTALGLLALTIGVSSWKAPATAQDYKLGVIDLASTEVTLRAPIDPAVVPPFEVRYVPEGRLGVYAIRPSAILRRPGMGALSPLIREMMSDDFGLVADNLKVDRSRPGFVKLLPEDIESIVGTFDINARQAPKLKERERKLYALDLGDAGGLTIRTVAPFDWLAFLRQWKVDLEEIREPKGVYHKIRRSSTLASDVQVGISLPDVGVYMPDDRTLVYENEAWIKQLIAREVPSAPGYLRGAEWDRVGGDLFALAMDNHDDEIAKRMTLGRPDDVPVLAFFKGVERIVLGLADSDALTPRAEVTGRDPQAAEATARTIQTLVDFCRANIVADAREPHDLAAFGPMAEKFLAALRVGHEGRAATVSAGGFGTFADLAGIVKTMAEDGSLEIGPNGPKAQAARAEEKSNKR